MEDGVFPLLLDAALFPLVRQFVANGDGTHPILNSDLKSAVALLCFRLAVPAGVFALNSSFSL
jgi:hypothetical protein